MHRNTVIVVFFLSVVAALLVGFNFGIRMRPITQTPVPIPTSASIPATRPTLAITSQKPATISAEEVQLAKKVRYTNTQCGVTLSYPDVVLASESSTTTPGVVFTNKKNPEDIVVLTCQKDIPRPAVPEDQTELRRIGSISGILYHDSSMKDGSKSDALIFTHPKTRLDVFIGGYGAVFNAIIATLQTI